MMVGGLPAIGVSNKWIWYSTLVYHMKNKGLPKMIYKHDLITRVTLSKRSHLVMHILTL